MFRKRRRPTPGFGIPSPYNPMTGEHANLQSPGIFPYCAMMQVAEDDDYEDYVICRGFDPRIGKFIDYESGNDSKPGISVAKPFGRRVTDMYEKGEIYPAFLPTQGPAPDGFRSMFTPPSPSDVDWRVGQNPGTATPDPLGHPADLNADITELTDHNNKNINWLLIDSGAGRATRVRGQLVGAMLTSDATHGLDNLSGINGKTPSDSSLTCSNVCNWAGDDNAVAWAEYNVTTEAWEFYQVQC